MENNKSKASNPQQVIVYQLRPDLGYPVFLQFADLDLEQELQFIIHEAGFVLSKKEALDSGAKERKFRLLRVSSATPKVLKKITSYSEHAFGLGQEIVENFGYYEVYVMMRYAMMIMSQSSSHWEMAFDKERVMTRSHETETQAALRLCFNRFVSSSLAFMEVMSFWGQVKNKTIQISNQSASGNNCILIDVAKNRAFSNSFAPLNLQGTKIHITHEKNTILKEELFSILASRALYFSSGQIPKAFMVQYLTQLVRNQDAISASSHELSAAS